MGQTFSEQEATVMKTILVRGFKIAGKALAVLVIVAIVGWFAIPSLRMYQFESALEAKNYEAAMALVGGPRGTVPRKDVREATFESLPLTWEDFLGGKRFISVRTVYVVDGREYADWQNFWATAIFLDQYGC
jgi:hypothetical protein